MEKSVHLIALNIPYPPDYGGVIDIYHKIKSLHELGVKISLHCFDYGREHADELNKVCKKVYYYQRKKGFKYIFSSTPYIVKTRDNKQLLANLSNKVQPIIFDGLHTTLLLKHPKLKEHKKIVRTHNIEHEYYHYLSRTTKSIKESIFFTMESAKLKRYEKVLSFADELLCISPSDTEYFRNQYGKGLFIPAFHPFNKVNIEKGKGEYILFHGNLEVAENLNAINFLIDEIFSEITFPFIIAGKNPPVQLIEKIKNIPHITIQANVNNEAMDKLITNAHICLIPTFQATGLKLKLLSSLFAGRHCVTNSPMVQHTGLEPLCQVADTKNEMIRAIKNLMEIKLKKNEVEKRKRILEEQFSNKTNAQKIIDIL